MEEKDTRAAAPRPLTDSDLDELVRLGEGGYATALEWRAAALAAHPFLLAEVREARRLLGEALPYMERDALHASAADPVHDLLDRVWRVTGAQDSTAWASQGLRLPEQDTLTGAEAGRLSQREHSTGQPAAGPSSPSLLDPGEQKT